MTSQGSVALEKAISNILQHDALLPVPHLPRIHCHAGMPRSGDDLLMRRRSPMCGSGTHLAAGAAGRSRGRQQWYGAARPAEKTDREHRCFRSELRSRGIQERSPFVGHPCERSEQQSVAAYCESAEQSGLRRRSQAASLHPCCEESFLSAPPPAPPAP